MAERTSPVQQTQPPSLEDPNAVEVNHETAPSDHQIQVSPAVYYYNDPFLLPPGFRFVPKDKEIIYYLNSFLHGHLNPFLYGYSIFGIDIHLVNIYKYNPEQLAADFKKGNDKSEWFFITERRKKYDRGTRPDCSANGGYWKATGKEAEFQAGKDMLGFKRTLVFHTRNQPRATKTEWIMKEYRLNDPPPPPSSNNMDNKMLDTVLCKIYKSPMGKERKAEEEQEVEDKDFMTQSAVLGDIAYYYKHFIPRPGFRFVPKKEELILDYLEPFLRGYSFPNIDIHHVNIYNYHPEQLAAGFKKGNDENEWFFITERRKKYDRGTRTDCSANGGYWKATESETKFRAGKDMLGSQRTLVFYNGKQPRSSKTDWIMKEYRLDDPLHPPSSNNEDNKMLDTVLCKFYLSPMGKKMKAEEEQEVEGKYLLPRPSSMDELSRIFYPRQQKASRLGDSTEDHSLDPNLSEDMGGRLTKIPRTF